MSSVIGDDLVFFCRKQIDELNTFNRHVAHDLRAPLAGLAGAARRAAQAFDEGDVRLAKQLLPKLAQQAEKLASLVAELLRLAEAGDAPITSGLVDLRAIVEESIAEVQSLVGPNMTVPQFVVGRLPTITGSAPLLRQVFVNLFMNAVKFASPLRPCVVEVHSGAPTPGQLAVHVKDNGVGFDAQQASRLFTPFARLHGPQYSGHGIGLSLVKRIVDRHGGHVSAEPCSPFGAVFVLTFPQGELRQRCL